MEKRADTDHDIHDLLARRWSARVFSGASVTPAQLGSLLEAARWAASCFNEQPWRFVVALRDDADALERLLGCLNEKNRAWASQAGALAISVAATTFAHNQKPNRYAWHDVGQAAAQLALQATALGLAAHQMAGFDAAKAREVLGIPEGFEPVAAIAIGAPGSLDRVPDDVRAREQAPRVRKALSEVAFAGAWGAPLPLTPR